MLVMLVAATIRLADKAVTPIYWSTCLVGLSALFCAQYKRLNIEVEFLETYMS